MEDLKKLLAAATPGPWFIARNANTVGDCTPEDAALIVAAVNALPELLALRETLKDVVDWYDKEHPMRQADWHNPKCGCVRCKFDRARAALNQETDNDST